MMTNLWKRRESRKRWGFSEKIWNDWWERRRCCTQWSRRHQDTNPKWANWTKTNLSQTSARSVKQLNVSHWLGDCSRTSRSDCLAPTLLKCFPAYHTMEEQLIIPSFIQQLTTMSRSHKQLSSATITSSPAAEGLWSQHHGVRLGAVQETRRPIKLKQQSQVLQDGVEQTGRTLTNFSVSLDGVPKLRNGGSSLPPR